MEIRWARSATRHRIARLSSGYVVYHPQAVIREAPPADSPDERIVFLGADQDGTLLEVMAVEVDNALLIIHAMPARPKYLAYLKGDTDDQA
jgi:uncharacterized DUF497 family protein